MALDRLCSEYKINPNLAQKLHELQKFEIVIVCDDSGSMMTPLDGTHRTRWQDLCQAVKLVTQIGLVFDSNGLDICFLNRRTYRNIKTTEEVDHAFSKRPCGFTPLAPVLRIIFESPLTNSECAKKLVFIATDGCPTDYAGSDDIETFMDLLETVRNNETTYVSFLLCTDEEDCIDQFHKCCDNMNNIYVTEGYPTEATKIRRSQGYHDRSFTYIDYIVKALVGPIIHTPTNAAKKGELSFESILHLRIN